MKLLFSFFRQTIFTFIIALYGCTSLSPQGEGKIEQATSDVGHPTPEEARIHRIGKLWGPDFLTFSPGSFQKEQSEDSPLMVNKYLWHATLESLSHMPLRQVDVKSGVVLTDWYQDPEDSKEKLKIDVRVLSDTLKSDGLIVSVFRRKRAQSGEWVDCPMSVKAAESLAKVILYKAKKIKFFS